MIFILEVIVPEWKKYIRDKILWIQKVVDSLGRGIKNVMNISFHKLILVKYISVASEGYNINYN